MKQIIKLAILGALLAFTAFAAFKTCATRRLSLGQKPMTEEEQIQAMVKQYIKENQPEEEVNSELDNILEFRKSTRDGKVMTVEKAVAAEFLRTLNEGLPIQLTDMEIESLASEIQAAKPTRIVKKFNTEDVNEISSKGFTASHQAFFIIFPADEPEEFVISARYSKRSGVFAPIVTEVIEKKCKKSWFGFKETCVDVVKRVVTPRVVDDRLKAETSTYLTAKLLEDILSDRTVKFFDNTN